MSKCTIQQIYKFATDRSSVTVGQIFPFLGADLLDLQLTMHHHLMWLIYTPDSCWVFRWLCNGPSDRMWENFRPYSERAPELSSVLPRGHDAQRPPFLRVPLSWSSPLQNANLPARQAFPLWRQNVNGTITQCCECSCLVPGMWDKGVSSTSARDFMGAYK